MKELQGMPEPQAEAEVLQDNILFSHVTIQLRNYLGEEGVRKGGEEGEEEGGRWGRLLTSC